MTVDSFLQSIAAPRPVQLVVKTIVAMYQSLRHSSSPFYIRVVIGILMVLVYGGIGYILAYLFGTGMRYETQFFALLVTYEFLYAIKPFVFGLAPAVFIALMYIFQKTNVKTLIVLSLAIGVLCGAPRFIQTMQQWLVFTNLIRGLPVEQVTYIHSIPETSVWSSPQAYIRFVIPEQEYPSLSDTIERRILVNGVSLHFFIEKRLSDGTRLSPPAYDITQYAGTIHGEIYGTFE